MKGTLLVTVIVGSCIVGFPRASLADWTGGSLTFEVVSIAPTPSFPPSPEDPVASYNVSGDEGSVGAGTNGYPGEAHAEVIFSRTYTWSGGGTPTAAIVWIDGYISGSVVGDTGLGTAASTIYRVGLSATVHGGDSYGEFDYDWHTLSSTDRVVSYTAYAYAKGECWIVGKHLSRSSHPMKTRTDESDCSRTPHCIHLSGISCRI